MGKQVERQAAMETARVDCWNTLVPKLPEIYRGSPESNDLIQFRITAPDAAARRQTQFAVVNTSRQTLTDVTLVLDLLHYSTAPEPTVFQVFFIPVWQAGEEFRLPTAIAQNRHHGEMSKMRPVNADPGPASALWGIHGEWVGPEALHRGGNDPSGSDPTKSWLAGVGGLVAVQASLWSAQANQPVHIFPFPDQALAGARRELDAATRLAANLIPMMMRNKKLPPNAKFTLPADFWEVRAAKRVLTFVPPDSDLARRANLLIDDPVQLIRETPADNLATARPRSGTGGPGMGREGIDALVARPGTGHPSGGVGLSARRWGRHAYGSADHRASQAGRGAQQQVRPHHADHQHA